jgi:Spy/CpxP family protein refolding chaperone
VRDGREALRAVRRAQFEAVHGATFDEERIRAAAADTARAQTDVLVTRARIASEMRALLTAEQRQELDDMLAEARARAERRGRRD